MDQQVKGNVQIDVSQKDAPYTIFQDPASGADVVLLDPDLARLTVAPNTIKADTLDGFAQIVAAVLKPEGNRLVELSPEGVFVFRDKLGPQCRNVAAYALKTASTTKVLCVAQGVAFSQRDLLRWNIQWPGTLTPVDENPEAVWEEIAGFKVTSTKNVASTSGDAKVSIMVEQEDFAEGSFPLFWRAKSALFEDGKEVEATLRMTLKLPDIDPQTQRISGAPVFEFTLWTPDKVTLLNAGMADAIERARGLLPADCLVVRATVALGELAVNDAPGKRR